jgi:hypothetical protein
MSYRFRKQRIYEGVYCADSRRSEAWFCKTRGFVHLRHDDPSFPKPPCDVVRCFVGTYKNTDSWKLKARLNRVNQHHPHISKAAAAYPEMAQREQYREAIDWLRSDAEKLESEIEYLESNYSTQVTVCLMRRTRKLSSSIHITITICGWTKFPGFHNKRFQVSSQLRAKGTRGKRKR